MSHIPNLLFSKLLFKYPKLWGVNSEWVNWDVDSRQLGATLTDKLGYRVTTNDVRFKIPYLNELIGETINGKTMELLEKYLDEYTEEIVRDHFEEMSDERIREIVTGTFGGTMGEQTTARGIKSPAKVDNREIDIYFNDEGPSTSVNARQRLAEWQIEREQSEQVQPQQQSPKEQVQLKQQPPKQQV
uniref:Uncharacterized protein n=1 Tax=Glossina austeni TaxID=7395 RepID=A0A1A9VPF4_GLOAU